MSNQPIIFFFVGDISNKKSITEYTTYAHPNLRSIKGDNKRIFDKLCLSNEIKIGERLKINDNSSLVYNFTILQMLKEKGKDFHKNAKETERITWWHNCKIKIILFLILTIIIGLIAYKIIYR